MTELTKEPSQQRAIPRQNSRQAIPRQNSRRSAKKAEYEPVSDTEAAKIAFEMSSLRQSRKQGQLGPDAFTDSMSDNSAVVREELPKQLRKQLSLVGYVTFGVLFFLFLLFFFGPEESLPDGALWAVLFLWTCSTITGNLFSLLGIPDLLGQLLIGMLLRNLPDDEEFLNIPKDWSDKIKAFGLCMIFLRAGLELDIKQILNQGLVSARLTVCPGVVEALVVGAVGSAIFDMPFSLAVSMGFILAAVSPAVVVTGMFNLQHCGFGVAKGIPSLVVAAASFDDVVALTGFSVSIGSAIHIDGENKILQGFHAPIEVFGAAFLGLIFGHLCGCTQIWKTHTKRLLIVIAVGMATMYFAVYFHYNSMGALGCLMIGLVASQCWSGARLGWLSDAPNTDYAHEVEHDIARIWKYFAQPLLFAVIGSSIDFSEISSESIPKAIIVIVSGVTCRVLVAISVTWGNNLRWIERIFIGLSWIPKATVQAALGSIPLTLIQDGIDADDPDYDEWVKWGNEILVTAVFAILITAPIGVVCIDQFGPRWLEYSDPTDARHDATWIRNEALKRLDVEEEAEKIETYRKSFFQQMKDAIKKAEKSEFDEKSKKMYFEKIFDAANALEEILKEEELDCEDLFNYTKSYIKPSETEIDPMTGKLTSNLDDDSDVVSIPRLLSGANLRRFTMLDGASNIRRKSVIAAATLKKKVRAESMDGETAENAAPKPSAAAALFQSAVDDSNNQNTVEIVTDSADTMDNQA